MTSMKSHLKGAVAACAFALAAGSQAQAQNIYAFGDSFLDVGNSCNFPGGIGGVCSNGRNTAQHLAGIAGYNLVGGGMNGTVGATDYAVGGTVAFPGAAYPKNYFDQIQQFAATGARIGPNDVTLISSGQNEQFQFTPNTALAVQTAVNMAAGVGELINLGGRNFVVTGGVSLDRLVSILGVPLNPTADYSGYQTTLATALQSDLSGYARPGVQIRWLDLRTLLNRALDAPSMYGFAAGTDCLAVPGCATAPRSVQNQYPFYNTHPSDSFALIVANYVNNLLHAQDEIPAQAQVSQGVAIQFSNAIFDRLSATRAFDTYGFGNGSRAAFASMDTQAPVQGIQAARQNPWSVYAAGAYANGERDDKSGVGGSARGFTYDSPGGIIGLEYKFNPSLRGGFALSYQQPNIDFNNVAGLRGGKLTVNSGQLAAYTSYTSANWFADVVFTYGHNSFDIARPGVIDTINANTDGSSFSASWKSAYLFDTGKVRIGPLVGLQYVRSRIDAYTERGDSVLTQLVNGQTAQALVGEAGVQIRLLTGGPFSSFINVTAEHDFLGNGRTLVTAQTDALVLPIYTVVPGSEETYGKIAAGLAAQINERLSCLINVSSTFARSTGNDRAVSGGVKLSF